MLVIVSSTLGSAYFLSMVQRETVNSLLMSLLVDSFPNSFNALLVVQTLENSITSNHEEIEVRLELKHPDLRVNYDHIWVASITSTLRLNITKCP